MTDLARRIAAFGNLVVSARVTLSEPQMGGSHVVKAQSYLDLAVPMIPALVSAEQERAEEVRKRIKKIQCVIVAAREVVDEERIPRAMLVRGHAISIENEIPRLDQPAEKIEEQETAIEQEARAWHELANKLEALHSALLALDKEVRDED